MIIFLLAPRRMDNKMRDARRTLALLCPVNQEGGQRHKRSVANCNEANEIMHGWKSTIKFTTK